MSADSHPKRGVSVKKTTGDKKGESTTAQALADAKAREERLKMPIVSVLSMAPRIRTKRLAKRVEERIRLRQEVREEYCRKIAEWAEAYMTALPGDDEDKRRDRERAVIVDAASISETLSPSR
jgi:hypothetical protein